MLGLIISIVIEGVILIAMLTVLTDDEFESDFNAYFKAGALVLGGAIVAVVVSAVLSVALPGFLAGLIGIGVAAGVLGFLISLLYGLSLQRSLLVVAGYAAVKVVLNLISYLFGL